MKQRNWSRLKLFYVKLDKKHHVNQTKNDASSLDWCLISEAQAVRPTNVQERERDTRIGNKAQQYVLVGL